MKRITKKNTENKGQSPAGTRKERKARANNKRKMYINLILKHLLDQLDSNPNLVFKKILIRVDMHIQHMINNTPGDAHLIRSAAIEANKIIKTSLLEASRIPPKPKKKE